MSTNTHTQAQYLMNIEDAGATHPVTQVRVILQRMRENTKREVKDFSADMQREFWKSRVNVDSIPAYVAVMTHYAETHANSGSVFTAEHQAEATRVAIAAAQV